VGVRERAGGRGGARAGGTPGAPRPAPRDSAHSPPAAREARHPAGHGPPVRQPPASLTASGRERWARAPPGLAFRPFTPQGGREALHQPAPALPAASGRVPVGERAQTCRARLTRPGIPPAHLRGVRERARTGGPPADPPRHSARSPQGRPRADENARVVRDLPLAFRPLTHEADGRHGTSQPSASRPPSTPIRRRAGANAP